MAISSRTFLFSLIITTLSFLPTTTQTTIGATLHHIPTTQLVSVDQLASSLHHHNIHSIRLLDPDPTLIRSFTYSSISLLLSIPNSLIPSLAANESAAAAWLYTHVVPFYPRANITFISVGSDVTVSPSDVTTSLLPAVRNLHVALHQLGIKKISVSSTFSLISALTTAYPPSSAEFQEPIFDVVIRPLLDFLEEANSSFLVNIYPYNIYRDVSHEIPIGFALFQESPYSYRDDPTTGARYRNLFDVMVDAVLAAMAVAGHENIPLVVTETGWPSAPGADAGEDSDANPEFAEMYLCGLAKHLKSGKGTPLKKDGISEVYMYEVFDKEKSNRDEKVRQWGIFYPNLTGKYHIDFSAAATNNTTESHRRCMLIMIIVIYLLFNQGR